MVHTRPQSGKRRSFLKIGVIGAAIVGVGGWFAGFMTDRGARTLLGSARWLDAQAQTMIARLADAVLDGALPAEPAARATAIAGVVAGADQAITALPPHLQKELGELLAMLGAAPTRALLIGQWTGWADITRDETARMLTSLRGSSVTLRRVVYMTLRDLVAGSYYASADTWEQVGYPGPMIRGPGPEV
jgi:hypothetical protein